MRYAISYVSTANIDLQQQGVNDIMNETNIYNKGQEITGILLYNKRSFFQLIEGEKEIIQPLYEKIIKDSRHQDIIKFLEKPVFRPAFDGYLTDFITDSNKFDPAHLKDYLHYIEVLEPESQRSLKRVIELMMV
ncbi:MAG: BLUF domain-containing protein [Salegentibacter sp.]|uniref:Sensors of blue-light using FAD n=1 Tax=Salegentibacter flavus TaxID=287099 RepID=A0A1I5CVE3_9FLAO|nr:MULTISPECIES: BLUF domain-containing protein [Salegentibacter]MDR9457866.1 BLUF domain-containing protein [Salegentibacter sp.]SFN90903.1 Sensors of blue-light using FAD [Salegentibacter flavus]